MSSLITYPSSATITFESYNLKLARKSTSLRSPFTGKRQTVNFPFAVWLFNGKYTVLQNIADIGAMRAFLTLLEGRANKFRLPVPGYAGPSTGYAGAAGLVNGANQTGKSLVTDGWTGSVPLFKAGDYFTVNDELKVISADVSSAAGAATLTFEPALRTSPADNLALIVAQPTVLLNLNMDDPGWDVKSPVLHDIAIDCEECIE